MNNKISYPFYSFNKISFEELFSRYESDLKAKDKEGNTLAHLAVIYNKYDYLERLEELLDNENVYGITPIQLAEFLGRPIESPGKEKVNFSVFLRSEKKVVDFTKEKIKEHFDIEYLDRLEFKNISYLNYVLKNIKKSFKKSDLKWKNHWTCCMHENCLKERAFPKTYVKWIDPLIGYGLFAGEDIPEYTFIGEYSGVIRKRQGKKDRVNDYIFGYVVTVYETPFVIDAKEKGNYTRFINHCDEPNLLSTWMVSGGVCHIILFANRFIPKDTQLTYDYGPNFWKKRPDPQLL